MILIFISFSLNTHAQQEGILKGLVFKKGTSQRLQDISIENKTSKKFILSDEWGNFSISANIGDTLLFKKEGFQEFEKIIRDQQNLIIYLEASILLEEVVVKQKTTKQEQQEILDGYRSKGVYYNGNPPLLVYLFNPLTALHELLGKDANNAKNFGNYIQRENAESRVDAHFNAQIIRTSIKIKDNELVEFMYLYRPKPKEVIYRNTYDDMAYIKKSYRAYLKMK